MSLIASLVFFIYVSALFVITVYCLTQAHLLYKYKKYHCSKTKQLPETPLVANPSNEKWPFVTIQLPIFNEMYVVERLIDAVMQMDYPIDRFEVQVLDDSTDETLVISKRKVEEYRALGFNIEQVVRQNRTGFKAGALKDAMASAKGGFIAIFDADFLPKKDFLKATLSYFKDASIGVVQTRWEHINEDYSLLTKLQALQLNVHFHVEQQGRNAGSYLLQFNGTAGVWRRSAIEDAGGWEADTLTEDLDLSIRAQLKGWQIMYLEDVTSPGELPVEMNGLKSQQYRWMKGGAETAKKMLPAVWRSELNFGQKFHATLQLGAGSVFIFVFLMGVFSVPALFLPEYLGWHLGLSPLTWCSIGLIAIIAVQYVSNVQTASEKGGHLKRLVKFTLLMPLFLSLTMGLSFHNSIAVIQGLLGRKTAFVRTPKFNIKSLRDTFRASKYLTTKISWSTYMEGLLALYFALAVLFGYQMQNMSFALLHTLFALGYGTIFVFTIRHLSFKN